MPVNQGAIEQAIWRVVRGDGPLVGLALHAGHEMREPLQSALAIDDEARRREEDPHTDYWTRACGTRILTRRSRFEVDLNRPPGEAVCVQPEDCWNLHVWKEVGGLTPSMVERSLAEHDAFYQMLEALLREIEAREGRFVVFDLHSYNHRRDGPDAPPADPAKNPEINVGTGTMDRDYWGPVVDRFIGDLGRFDYLGRHLDVRENVTFRGRYLAEFVHTRFPRTGCVLAIEVKKFFMDEWTGQVDQPQIDALLDAFKSTSPGIEEALRRI